MTVKGRGRIGVSVSRTGEHIQVVVTNTAKGVRALRDALTDLGVPSSGYSPANGSGLGHQNRIAPATMADLRVQAALVRWHDLRANAYLIEGF